ncbi:MAG: hypothetical protein H6Q76_2127 [Firmicutes bacterium]|nr:hypothetical protein [Bacillota bacterium]
MSEIHSINIYSVKELLDRVARDTTNWTRDGFARPWFRGHTDIRYKLLPSILRSGNDIHEFNLTKKFRLMAPGFGAALETSRLDRWLFLMQHHRAPTRLLKYLELPSAIYPSTIHARIASQKGCFTLHGADKRDFESIFSGRTMMQDKRLIKYRIPKEKVCEIFQEVWDLGITYATLFPDLDGLARELKYSFRIKG